MLYIILMMVFHFIDFVWLFQCNCSYWLAVYGRLIHDRELELFDGRRLLRHDRYDKIKEQNSFSDDVMKEK